MPEEMPSSVAPEVEYVAAPAAFENPLTTTDTERAALPRGGANVHGSFSIETFCDQGSLSLTHEDAAGWRDYLNKFSASNFWYADGGVQPWAYYEQYDNWQDSYGMDAVMAAYHSGHGGMDANGVFYVPMGHDWGGLGCTATSNNMRLGNEHLRYLFWSTCESLRVFNGHSPIRTWQPANLGVRMIFGFETTSWDNANYGKFFWEEWNKGKSFSTAWLDASWRIAHDQGPTVTACGATQQEAQDRLFNERYFNGAQASRDWWWWRWYTAASAARTAQRKLPRELQLANLRPLAASTIEPARVADRFGFASDGAGARRDGSFSVRDGERYVARDASGGLSVRLVMPNQDNHTPLALGRARGLAEDAIRQFSLDTGNALIFDRAIHAASAGGTTRGSGQLEPTRTTETIFQFRQLINGVPVISPGAGTVRVGVDNDGQITRLHSGVREVEELTARARTRPPHPLHEGVRPASAPAMPTGPNGVAGGPGALSGNGATGPAAPAGPAAHDDIDAILAPAVAQRMRELMGRGGTIVGVAAVPGTAEIGYDFKGDAAELVARKGIEIDFGGGFRKRYWVQTTLFG